MGLCCSRTCLEGDVYYYFDSCKSPNVKEVREVPAKQSLYIRLGGEAAINAAVDLFYVKVLADVKLAPFFKGQDMERLKGHQRRFMSMAFGGNVKYSGKSIADAHAHMIKGAGLNALHFDLVAGHLVSTLAQLGVSQDLINEVVAVVGPLRSIFE